MDKLGYTEREDVQLQCIMTGSAKINACMAIAMIFLTTHGVMLLSTILYYTIITLDLTANDGHLNIF